MVQLENVTLVYENSGTTALEDLDLNIGRGEFAFLVGPSDSGKTSIIKLLTGELRATEGEVYVNGFDMVRIKRRKLPKMRQIGRASCRERV